MHITELYTCVLYSQVHHLNWLIVHVTAAVLVTPLFTPPNCGKIYDRMHLPHPNKMTVDLCDTKGLPLSEEEQSRIPRFQRAMRSTVGAILFALVAFMVAPIPLVYIGCSLPILLWARVINPRSARLVIDYCCSRWIYVMVVSVLVLF